ncbi:MAG: thioredoxin family protein [Deltaproteobacteria bacterium]
MAPVVPPLPPPSPGAAGPPGEGWNAAQIDWLSYTAGLVRARNEHKPVCLVFHADWCPHCRTYARVFEDPRVVARARDLVMVRVNVDQAPDIAGRYQIDGPYVPRTYFLSADGATLAGIDAHRPQFRYFFDEHDPNSLLAGMDAALRAR